MASILAEKWLWILIVALILITLVPLVMVLVILILPFPFNTLATILVVLGWGVVAGYKEWIISKRKEEKQKSQS